jgi:hypothetical protein
MAIAILTNWTMSSSRGMADHYRYVPTLGNAGAGEGNRTLVISLEGCCSTIELHPPKRITCIRKLAPTTWLSEAGLRKSEASVAAKFLLFSIAYPKGAHAESSTHTGSLRRIKIILLSLTYCQSNQNLPKSSASARNHRDVRQCGHLTPGSPKRETPRGGIAGGLPANAG